MIEPILSPTSPQDVQDIVQAYSKLRLFGGRSKSALHLASPTPQLDLSGLSGILEYDPGEYTFTALAGTPIQTIAAALAENGQYLPFDPLLADRATLGGTVATNLSGPGRFRYGGVRDFIIGCRFIDGQGQLVRGGGKVVKNAAGFDLPKFFVGSLGRYGVLTELTFKVFPQPRAYRTLRARFESLSDLLQASFALATSPLEMDAQEFVPEENAWHLDLRVGGIENALPERLTRLEQFISAKSTPTAFSALAGDEEDAHWAMVNRFGWVEEGKSVVKVPIAPKQIEAFDQALATTHQRRYSVGGNVAWLAAAAISEIEPRLNQFGLVGLAILGEPIAEPILGKRPGLPLAQRIKQALDPGGKFGPA